MGPGGPGGGPGCWPWGGHGGGPGWWLISLSTGEMERTTAFSGLPEFRSPERTSSFKDLLCVLKAATSPPRSEWADCDTVTRSG